MFRGSIVLETWVQEWGQDAEDSNFLKKMQPTGNFFESAADRNARLAEEEAELREAADARQARLDKAKQEAEDEEARVQAEIQAEIDALKNKNSQEYEELKKQLSDSIAEIRDLKLQREKEAAEYYAEEQRRIREEERRKLAITLQE